MEVVTEVPTTRTKLRIEPDRQFEDGSADSTLLIKGTSPDGQDMFESTYVETTPREATLISWVFSFMRHPDQDLPDELVREIATAFGMSAADATRLTSGMWQAIGEYAGRMLEEDEPSEHLAMLSERFDRAYARSSSTTGGSTL